MNEYLKEYIDLKKKFAEQDEDKDSVLALYQFADRLALIDEKDAKEVLVDVYQQLYLMESAFKLFVNICDKNDRKQIKKLANLQNLSQSHGDRFALPRPLTDAERSARKERLKDLPFFKYHPDPLETGSFEEGEEKICPCCGNKSKVYYSSFPYCSENVEYIQHAYQMEKQQGSLMQTLYKMLSGMASLIWKRMMSFFIVHLVT